MTTFDGDALVISLSPGTSEVSILQLYSEWKNWQLSSYSNLGYPQAFRVLGGDSLTPGINAGTYFFLQNDAGWRIRPAEEDATILFTGNLAPEDSTLPMVIPTLGSYTVLINGLQPITQSVASLLTLQQESLYNGEVHLDTINGTAGTDFPIGTASEPCLTMVDAMAIAARVGVKRLVIRGSTQLVGSMIGWTFVGRGSGSEIDFNGQDISGSLIEHLEAEGSLPALSLPITLNHCDIAPGGLIGVRGYLSFCKLEGDVTLAAGHTTLFKCASDIAGLGLPRIIQGGAAVDLSVRDWVGGLELLSLLSGSKASFDLSSGRLILGTGTTGGELVVRGIGLLEDNRPLGHTSTLDKRGLIDPEALHRLHQVSAGPASISPDGFTVTIYDEDGVTPVLELVRSSDGKTRTLA